MTKTPDEAMRPVSGQWKSSGNIDIYSNKAGRREVVGGPKGKAKERRREGRGGLEREGNTSVMEKLGGKAGL